MAPVTCVTLLLATAIAVAANAIRLAPAQEPSGKSPIIHLTKIAAPIATSGNNVFIAWANNDTGHWNVFVAKGTDAGKTLKTMMISTPNKGSILNHETQISASGSNVYDTWWTNKTGTEMPLFRTSNDNGAKFGKTIMLNSTAFL